MKEIDVIIPVYKAQKTLFRCLSSIASQTCINLLNVIIVQDGDKKNYDNIINKFEDVLDIKFIENEQNIGPGLTRQIGIDNSNSKYIIFIDADDTFADSYSIEILYNNIITKNKNAIFSNFFEEEDNKTFYEHKKDTTWLFGKIYERNFLIKNNIKFFNLRENEDASFNFLVLAKGEIEFIDTFTYFWHKNNNSITNNPNYMFNSYESYVKGIIKCFEFLSLQNNDNKIQQKMFEKATITMIILYIQYQYFINVKNKEDMNKFLSWCKLFYNKIYSHYLNSINIDILSHFYTQYWKDNPLAGNYYIPSIGYQDFIKLIGG